MKKILFALIVTALSLSLLPQTASAGGDKVRGDESEGPSYQEGECPFKG